MPWLRTSLLVLLVAALWPAPQSAEAGLNFYSRLESATLDGTHDFSIGDTTGTAFLSPAFSTTYSCIGSGSGSQYNSNAEQIRFDNTSPAAIVDRLQGTFATWVRWETWGTSTVMVARGATTSNHITLQALGTTEMRLRINSSVPTSVDLDTTTASLTTGVCYFVVASWDQPNSLRRLRIYAAGDTDPASPSIANVTSSSAFTAPVALDNTTNGFLIGDQNSPGTYEMRTDNAFVYSTYGDGDSQAFNKRNITSYTEYAGSATPRNLMLMGVGN